MFKCPKCKKTFQNEEQLLNHLIDECNYSYMVAMEICDEQKKRCTGNKGGLQ